jgi:hypothetical protein
LRGIRFCDGRLAIGRRRLQLRTKPPVRTVRLHRRSVAGGGSPVVPCRPTPRSITATAAARSSTTRAAWWRSRR